MIEWDRIRELRDEIGVDDFDEIVVIFLQEADEVVESLGTGASPRSVPDDLHFLKGAALNLGLRQFADTCLQAEREIAAGRRIDLGAVVGGFHTSRAAFLSGLEGALKE